MIIEWLKSIIFFYILFILKKELVSLKICFV